MLCRRCSRSPSWISLPGCQGCFSTVIRHSFVHLLLLARQLHTVEDVDRTYRNADSVGDTDIKIHTNSRPMDTVLLANPTLPLYLVVVVLLFVWPPVREARILD